jgi:hypothetical protein
MKHSFQQEKDPREDKRGKGSNGGLFTNRCCSWIADHSSLNISCNQRQGGKVKRKRLVNSVDSGIYYGAADDDLT